MVRCIQATLFTLLLMVVACNQNSSQQTEVSSEEQNPPKESPTDFSALAQQFAGAYVSEGYETEQSGSDWVKFTLIHLAGDTLSVTVTSRDDIKDPSCSWEGKAVVQNDSLLLAPLGDGINMTLTMKNYQLDVWVEKEDDRFALMKMCGGGASLAGSYQAL